MTVQIYYVITFADNLIPEEFDVLKEYASIFGITNVSKDKASEVSFIIADEDERDIKDKLSSVAAWTGKIALDQAIVTISRREDYHTNYEHEELNLILMHGTRGSC